jgi:uncharacterized membrane protein
MENSAHLWAVGFDDMERAAKIRDEVAKLAERHCLVLLDSAVAVRFPDGTVTLDGEPFAAPIPLPARGWARFFAGLALGAPPLTASAVSALPGICSASTAVGIGDDFIRDAEHLMKPGTSALFVLDQAGALEAILQGISGLGGIVLKSNVDLERARLIQSALSSAATDRQ